MFRIFVLNINGIVIVFVLVVLYFSGGVKVKYDVMIMVGIDIFDIVIWYFGVGIYIKYGNMVILVMILFWICFKGL